VLDLLDKELEKRRHTFARYADDFIILVGSKRAGERVLRSVTSFVERKLKLKVNDTKSQVAPVNQCKFLGFTFHGGSLKWHESAVEKFKFQVKQLTGRSNGISMEKRISELTVYLRGWINYFGVGQGYQKMYRPGSLDSTSITHVLLENVAKATHKSQKFVKTRCASGFSYCLRYIE
jgi:RNA-directed DNA polymerase